MSSTNPPDPDESGTSNVAIGKRKASLGADETIAVANHLGLDKYDEKLYNTLDGEKEEREQKKQKTHASLVDSSQFFPNLGGADTFANVPTTPPIRNMTKSKGSTKAQAVLIGAVEKGSDMLPVRAEMYQNRTVNYRVHREDLTDDVAARHHDFLATKRQVQLLEVTYDRNLFPLGKDGVDIQSSTEAQKKARLMEYLESVGATPGAVPAADPLYADEPRKSSRQIPQKPAPKAKSITKDTPRASAAAPKKSNATGASKKAKGKSIVVADHTEDIVIGSWKCQPQVVVYSFLKTYGVPKKGGSDEPFGRDYDVAACYRTHPSEVDEDTIKEFGFNKVPIIPNHNDIAFLERYARESESETRAVIRKVLLATFGRPKEWKTTQASGLAADDDAPIPDIKEFTTADAAARIARQNMGFQRNISGSLRTKCPTRFTKDTGVVDESGDEDLDPAPTPAPSQNSKDDAKSIEIKNLKRKILHQDRKISQLENKLLAAKGEAAVPTTSISTKKIGKVAYDLMASGANAGKLMTKEWRKVPIGGKIFKEWIILLPATINMGETKALKKTMMDNGGEYTMVTSENNAGKLISEPALLETKEGTYVKWSMREEITEQKGFIL